jgi:hypothetical protein
LPRLTRSGAALIKSLACEASGGTISMTNSPTTTKTTT